MSADVEGVALVASHAGVARIGSGLDVSYEVRVRGSRAIWLCTLFETEPSGRYRLAPARAYVQVRPPETLVLSKALWPLPPDVAAEFPEVPCVLRLEPGRASAGRISVPEPVQSAHPYARGPGAVLRLDEIQRIELRIGYLPDAADLALHRGTDVDGRAFAYPDYAQALRLQEVLTTTVELGSQP